MGATVVLITKLPLPFLLLHPDVLTILFFLPLITTTSSDRNTAVGEHRCRPLTLPPLLLPPPPSSFSLPCSPPSKHCPPCMSLDRRQQHHRRPPSTRSYPITLLLPFLFLPNTSPPCTCFLPLPPSLLWPRRPPPMGSTPSSPLTDLSPTPLCTSQLPPRRVSHQFSSQPPALVMSAYPCTTAATSHASHFPPVRHPPPSRIDPTTLLLSLPLPINGHLPTCLTGVQFGAILPMRGLVAWIDPCPHLRPMTPSSYSLTFRSRATFHHNLATGLYHN